MFTSEVKLVGCGCVRRAHLDRSLLRIDTMSSRRFHSRCGDYIRFTENHTIASRVASYNNGVVFTEQPVALDTVFQVNILEYEDKWVESIVSVLTR